MARVSAIMIVLNGEAFIEEAVDSVRTQTLREWELLIVDDGSSDSTLSLASRFADLDPRIRVLRHPGFGTHGMSQSRNLGLKQAVGEFVAFIDADDVWLPAKLAEQVEIFDRNPSAAMVYGRTLIWNEWAGTAAPEDFFYSLGVAPDALYRPPRLFLQLLENVHQSPTTCNAMIRRTAALEVGGFDDRFRAMFEDQIFFARLLLLYPAYVSGKCWARYRQHSGSASSRADPEEVRRTHLQYLRGLRRFLVGHGKGFSAERLALEKMIKSLELTSLRHSLRTTLKRLARR